MREHEEDEEQPVACDLGALEPAERERRQTLASRLAGAAEEMREEPDGYAVRYPGEVLPLVAECIALERRCCPFFRFTLTVGPDGGPLWLSITGRAGVKAIIATVMAARRGVP